MTKENTFEQAAAFLPDRLRQAARQMTEEQKEQCEEFRLRAGQPFAACCGGQIVHLPPEGPPQIVTREDLELLAARCTGRSAHTYARQIAQGYLSLPGGCRLGLCGEGIVNEQGELTSFRAYTGANLRVARQVRGVAGPLIPYLEWGEGPGGVLILSPPGGGKTTLLRELVRHYSQQYNVALLDERGEGAACRDGVPQYDVGPHTDVMTGWEKSRAIQAALRALGPQLMAADEITTEQDVDAVIGAHGCGCRFLATAHGAEPQDLLRRPVYRRLLEAGVFRRLAVIRRQGQRRQYLVYEVREARDDEMAGGVADFSVLRLRWVFDKLYAGPPDGGVKVLCGRVGAAAI